MTEWAILAETPSEVWAGVITAAIVAIGLAASSFVVAVMTSAFQLWMSYKASGKVEAVRVELEKTTATNAEVAKAASNASEANSAKLDKIEQITNHNHQKMQEEVVASRKALEKANEEIAKGNKEIAEMAKALALVVQSKNAPATPAPVATPGLVVEGEIHDLVISNKPVEEKKP